MNMDEETDKTYDLARKRGVIFMKNVDNDDDKQCKVNLHHTHLLSILIEPRRLNVLEERIE